MKNQTYTAPLTLITVMPRLSAVLLGGLLFFLATATLSATTALIYTNDFEAYTNVATSLEDMADADPSGMEWAMTDDTAVSPTDAGAGIQVINWLSHSSSKALLFRNGTYADVSFFNARSGSAYQLDFWLYVHKAPGNRGFRISLRGEGADHNGDDYLAYGSVQSTAANIRYYDGVANNNAGYWSNTPAVHVEDTWQHHRIKIDPSALQMTVYIDDMVNPVIPTADLARCEIAVPTILRIQHEGDSADDGYCAIDDISLTVEDSRDLTTTFTESFETYPARTDSGDDADPKGPWITVETDSTGTGRALAPAKVQVVDSTVVSPHSGNKCLKLEGGQRAGSSIAWGVPPQSDVQITWWARVPASVKGQTATYLRMSLYGAENGNALAGDNALLGYGSRDGTIGDATSLTYYITAWVDSGIDFTPDTWEEYRLTTHTSQGRYTLIKNPSSASPQIIADRAPMIGTASNWSPVFMAAWSSSNGTNHPPVYVDDIEIKSLVSIPDPLGDPYSITNYGTRFTNWTVIQANAAVGKPVVDPRDNSTILVAVDATPPAGGIYRLQKVASGNWAIDPVPVIAGLDRPSGLAITANGDIWWTHDYNNDYTRSVGRLKWPWSSNVVETIVADVVDPTPESQDDDAIDLCVAPASFEGSIGHPGWIVVADRGVNGDTRNGVYVIDPATTELNNTNFSNFLVNPTASDLGNNLNSITALPASGEVATLAEDGTLVAMDGNGTLRYINALNLWPIGSCSAPAVTVDPLTGKIWGADDLKDELWSIDATTGADEREIGFLLTNPSRPERQMDFHESSLAFSPDGRFLVVTDASTANGGRLIIFHNEPISLPPFNISSVSREAQGVQLRWQSAGGAKYDVLRGTDLGNAASFQSVATNLTVTSFTDTNAPAGAAFYRVVAKP